MKPLVIRADASKTIGTGHVMRCLALAQEWHDSGGEVFFLTTSDSPILADRIRSEGMNWIVLSADPGSDDDAGLTGKNARKLGAEWVVIDGYHFTDSYMAALRNDGFRIVAIDDKAEISLNNADIIVNQNIYATDKMYPTTIAGQQLLLGTRFALIRKEFFGYRNFIRKIPEQARNILVTLGGSDPNNVTLKVIESLRDSIRPEQQKVIIIAGYNNPYFDVLSTAAGNDGVIRIIPPTTEMPNLMAWCDIALIAAGSTAWEMAFMGVPIVTLAIVENQVPVAEGLEHNKAAINLGPANHISREELKKTINSVIHSKTIRQDLSERIRNLVDGEGAGRIIMHLCDKKIRIRRVNPEDSQQLWKWANDPVVRLMSFHENVISWGEHTAWFRKKNRDPACYQYIAVNRDDLPIGQIRFDIRDNGRAYIDLSVDPGWRYRGLGVEIIRQGICRLHALNPSLSIHAEVKKENLSSLHAFTAAGFIVSSTGFVSGSPVIFMELNCEFKNS